jgi:hypothetical protein
MRQTSKAVLLLIASAQAVIVPPAYTVKAAAITPTLINQGSWAGYTGLPVYTQALVADRLTTTVNVKAAATTNNKTGITDGTTSCVSCVRGVKGGKRTVWCSAGWNYEYTTLLLTKDYPLMTKSKSDTEPQAWYVKGDEDGSTDLVKGDQGFCCYTLDLLLVIGNLDNDAATDMTTEMINRWTCPAKFAWTNASVKKANAIVADGKMTTTNWWCSDGSYNLKDDDAYATKGATATSN